MERTITRKEFFRLGFLRTTETLNGFVERVSPNAGTGNTPAPTVPTLSAFVRPPGALAEAEFLAACTQCDDCIRACPHWVIRKAGHEMGESVAETPIIVPKENPCVMCADFPCVTACEPKALVLDPNAVPRIGFAKVDIAACYMAQGQPCDYCMVHCPTKPKAIRAITRGEAAEVDLDLCTGCGKCAEICPPEAIAILDHRPTATGSASES